MNILRRNRIEDSARNIIGKIPGKRRAATAIFYVGAVILGIASGFSESVFLHDLMDFIATVFTRLFSFIAVPIIALALITTLAKLGKGSESGKIFVHTIFYTLLTTIISALVAASLFLTLKPENVPSEMSGAVDPNKIVNASYFDHILNVIPNNLLQPFVSGNVLSVLLIAAAFGIAIAVMPKDAKRDAVVNFIEGLQNILFILIRWLIVILPIGIMGFTAKLIAELEGGIMLGGLATYFAVVVGSNLIQMFIILPLILFIRGLNPLKVARGMLPAIAVAIFSKSSVLGRAKDTEAIIEKASIRKFFLSIFLLVLPNQNSLFLMLPFCCHI